MGLIFVLVFMGVFAVVALLMLAASSGDAQKAKQVQATLDSALATESPVLRDQIVNLRKSCLLYTSGFDEFHRFLRAPVFHLLLQILAARKSQENCQYRHPDQYRIGPDSVLFHVVAFPTG